MVSNFYFLCHFNIDHLILCHIKMFCLMCLVTEIWNVFLATEMKTCLSEHSAFKTPKWHPRCRFKVCFVPFGNTKAQVLSNNVRQNRFFQCSLIVTWIVSNFYSLCHFNTDHLILCHIKMFCLVYFNVSGDGNLERVSCNRN